MTHTWTHEEAKNSFEQIIEEALAHHEQIIELENRRQVLVIALEDYNKSRPAKNTLADFFKTSPLYGLPLDLERDKDTGRDVEL